MNEARENKKETKKNTGMETFHGLRVTTPVHTRTAAALECEHLSYQVRPLDCYFQ